MLSLTTVQYWRENHEVRLGRRMQGDCRVLTAKVAAETGLKQHLTNKLHLLKTPITFIVFQSIKPISAAVQFKVPILNLGITEVRVLFLHC